eukprot:scaffold9559_cov101-Isochrysis_galbana.AAC.9
MIPGGGGWEERRDRRSQHTWRRAEWPATILGCGGSAPRANLREQIVRQRSQRAQCWCGYSAAEGPAAGGAELLC